MRNFDEETYMGSLDAQIIYTLGQNRGRWFCTECVARRAGLPLPDEEYRIANYARYPLRAFTGYEVSETAVCDVCGKEGHPGPCGQRLIVRATA